MVDNKDILNQSGFELSDACRANSNNTKIIQNNTTLAKRGQVMKKM